MQLISIVNSISSIFFVLISLSVGMLIIRKYFQFGDRNFIYVGLAWIGLSEPWWPSAVSFIVALFNGTGLTPQAYLFIGNIFLPLFILFWLLAMENLIKLGKKHIIPIIFTVFSVFFEALLISFLILDYRVLGVMQGPVDVNFKLPLILFLFVFLMVVLVTGLLFAIDSVQSREPNIKLKGKFLTIAFISFTLGTIFDIIFTNIVMRLVLAFSAIMFYIGYTLPSKVKNLLLNQ